MVKFLHGNLKYGFFPTIRDIPYENHILTNELKEEEFVSSEDTGSSKLNEKNAGIEHNGSSVVSGEVASFVAPESTQFLEYRDEAKRPWYKFFDELEYSSTSLQRKHNRWSWFGPFKTKDERWTVVKLDLTLAVISMLAYWSKYLDSVNLNNAY
ncbi:hypothetical protein HANVADRAFT_103276, partial [Hanseniaspora valbyensis NRRL Y-1626]